MTRLKTAVTRFVRRVFPALTKDQANVLASIKFPCC